MSARAKARPRRVVVPVADMALPNAARSKLAALHCELAGVASLLRLPGGAESDAWEELTRDAVAVWIMRIADDVSDLEGQRYPKEDDR